MPSASKPFAYLFYMWRKYHVTATLMTLMSCDSVCCMCGVVGAVADWWRSWSMTNTLAHLCSCQWRTFWTYLMPVNLFSLHLMNFMFHTMPDAVRNILRVHYKSMKCDVSFSQGSVSTLFRWGENIFDVCVKYSSCLQQCKNYFKNHTSFFSRIMITNVLPRFSCITVYIVKSLCTYILFMLYLLVKLVVYSSLCYQALFWWIK